MAFPRVQTRTATGGAASGGGRFGGGGRGGAMFGGGGSRDYQPIPQERRAPPLRRIPALFPPYKLQVAVVLIAILTTSLIGLVNPLLLGLLLDQVIIGQDYSQLNLYVGLMIALPIISGLIGVRPCSLKNMI